MPVTSTDITNYIKKHIVAIIIIWLFVLILIKIITTRTSHDELFKWYNSQDDTQKSYSCISAWDISTSIEFPSILKIGNKPFQNSATPYFLDGMAKRFGDVNSMPPGSGMMTIDDWCIGLGMRLTNWASSTTNNFTDPPDTSIIVKAGDQGSVKIYKWTLTNLALSLDGGITVLDSYTVYQKYGSPIAWQYPQWKGWLSCRIRSPAFPSWSSGVAITQIISNYTTTPPFDPAQQTPNGTFVWGSPFVQTGYLAPFGCLGSGCADKGNCQANTCGFVPTVEGDNPCSVGGKCMTNAYKNHQNLPWTEPEFSSLGDIGCGQYAANNPFIAFNISASSPIILKFLGYGFDTPDITQTTTGTTVITYSGGPASDQYTQVSQFLDLVNGGFVKYSENFGKPQDFLENYLFGEYTYEAKGTNLTPKPQKQSPPPCGGGKLAGNIISGGMGGAGIGMMAAGAAGGPVGIAVGAGAAVLGAFGGYLSTDSNCGGGSDLCTIM